GTAEARVGASVHRVADDRVSDRGEMHADLMSAPGSQRDLEDGGAAKALDHAKVGDRFATSLDDRHAPAVAGMTGDRRVDGPGVLAKAAVDERPVGTAERAITQLPGQVSVRALALRNHQQPARIAVEAVHDPRPLRSTKQ